MSLNNIYVLAKNCFTPFRFYHWAHNIFATQMVTVSPQKRTKHEEQLDA